MIASFYFAIRLFYGCCGSSRRSLLYHPPPMLNRINVPTLFCIGLFICATLFTTGLVPAPGTFIHIWSVELPSAVLLALCCGYFIFYPSKPLCLARTEIVFVIAPVTSFILWSLLSASWAESWKSAVHHSLVWSMYLIFYLIARAIIETGRGRSALGLSLLSPILLFSIAAAAGYVSFVIFEGVNPLGRLAKVGEPALTILPLLLVFAIRSSGRTFQVGVASISLISLLIYCSLGRINFFLFAVVSVLTAVLILTQPSRAIEADLRSDAGDLSSGALTWRVRCRRLILTAAACLAALLFVQSFSIFSATQEVAPVALKRFGDDTAITSSNNFRMLVYSISKEMIVANPVLGVGGDNFGSEANKYRRIYSAKSPENVSLREAEDNLPERAHNEVVQIVAELGLPGLVIVLWFAAGLLLLFGRSIKALRRGSIIGLAALIGLGAFLTSSLVSSYSFRFVQNGFVFFFVLAIACRELWYEPAGDISDNGSAPERVHLTPTRIRLFSGAGLAACLLLTAYWGVRVTSAAYVAKANRTPDIRDAERLFKTAEQLDDENADAPYSHAMRLFHERRFSEAAPLLTESIRLGRGRSVDYSHLASAWSLAGDPAAAESAMAEAFAMYPQSTFVMARYSHVLAQNGKTAEAQNMLDMARKRHLGDANAWWTLMNLGADPASAAAVKDPGSYTALMELYPINAVYAVRDERFARFPEERARFDLFGTNR